MYASLDQKTTYVLSGAGLLLAAAALWRYRTYLPSVATPWSVPKGGGGAGGAGGAVAGGAGGAVAGGAGGAGAVAGGAITKN